MRIPKAIQNVIESFERLPGIGPKSAQRLTFYLLHVPQHELERFSSALKDLKLNTKICSNCFNVDESDPCSICTDPTRDSSVLCVVEQPLDVLAFEKGGKFKGIYHVLHGKIDPLNNIGPDEIFISKLISRVKGEGERVNAAYAKSLGEPKEIILATNPTMEGDATAMYIAKQLRSSGKDLATGDAELKITRIGRGLPIGADIEYADSGTLERAMENRSEF